MKLQNIIDVIENFAPLSLQAEYDNCGLKLGERDKEITGVLVTLDTNCAVVDEAIAKNCNLIIEHHPSIFNSIKAIDYDLPLSKAIVQAIKNDIAVYSAHTNIDFAEHGLNDRVAELIGMVDIYKKSFDGARIGYLPQTITLKAFADKIMNIFHDNNVKTVGDLNKSISKVAVINGGGGSSSYQLLETFREGCDIFISGDVKYNVSRLAKDLNYAIIDVGHYTSEQAFLSLISDILSDKVDIMIFSAESLTNPYNN